MGNGFLERIFAHLAARTWRGPVRLADRRGLHFDDDGFDGQLQRTVGKCDAGRANVGECLTSASHIASGSCPRTCRRLTRAEGAEGHCEGMAPIVFWTAAFDGLDATLR